MSVSNAAHHVQVVIDLLENAADTDWSTTQTPDVRRYQDDAQSERGPGADQPPVIYVWSPTGTTLEQFSVDGERFDRDATAEAQIHSLDSVEARQVQSDVIEIIGAYINDNKTETPFNTVKPVTAEDYREQNSKRRTDHFVMSVEIELRGLVDTALA